LKLGVLNANIGKNVGGGIKLLMLLIRRVNKRNATTT